LKKVLTNYNSSDKIKVKKERRGKKMKWYKVKVYFPTFVHLDEIQGKDEKHALERAQWNWPAAIMVICID
jgi:hypothetical protein